MIVILNSAQVNKVLITNEGPNQWSLLCVINQKTTMQVKNDHTLTISPTLVATIDTSMLSTLNATIAKITRHDGVNRVRPSQTPCSQTPSIMWRNISIALILDNGATKHMVMVKILEFLKKV